MDAEANRRRTSGGVMKDGRAERELEEIATMLRYRCRGGLERWHGATIWDLNMTTDVVNSAYQRLVVDKSITLSQLMEEFGPRLLSDSPDTREEALTDVVAVIQRLSNDFLNEEQVGMLMDFLVGRLETSALAGGNVLDGIRHLVLFSKNHPTGFEVPLFQSLFRDGNVQGWPQKDRAKQYDIMQWLLVHKKNEIRMLGSDVVMSFIRAMGGERDPRCLLAVFRIFLIVAAEYPLQPLVEDMFEVVACYYPVEFKPLAGDDSISRDMLSTACRSTLTANPQFAPFCLLLIEEKLEDDETTQEQKEDVCTLISSASTIFPPTSFLPYLPALLGGIRSVSLDPKQKTGPVSPTAITALCSLATAVDKCGAGKAKALALTMLENVEPFVLQAEMGLAARALELLRCLVGSSTSEVTEIVLDKCIAWIISLVQGTTVNAAGNRGDICREGLVFLLEWVQLARKHNAAEILSRYESTILASLDEAREIAPSESKTTLYGCLTEFIHSPPFSEECTSRCDSVIEKGILSVDPQAEREAFLSFISDHARIRWTDHKRLLQQATDKDSNKYADVLYASIVDSTSWSTLKPEATRLLETNLSLPRLNYLVSAAQRVSKDAEVVNGIAEMLCELALASKQEDRDLSVALQSIGLLVSAELHSTIARRALQDHSYLLRLFIAQTSELPILLEALAATTSDEARRVFVFSIVNRTSQLEDVPSTVHGQPWYDETVAKALLLAGNREGVERVKKLFIALAAGETVQASSLFDFESPDSDPVRCRYRTTALWRQRIFCQVVPNYIKSVVDAADKSPLLALLPQILRFAEVTGAAVQSQLSDFLPVFVAALKDESSPVSPSVLSALPSFLAGLRKDQLDALSVAIVTRRLALAVKQTDELSSTLQCLESLELLARRSASSSTQPMISFVVSSVTDKLAHKKRVVRQKAAAVKNAWEMLIAQ